MALAITHFAVGASITILVVWVFVPYSQYQGSLAVLGGIWALVPDFHYLSPVYSAEFKAIKHSIFGDIFWFHRFLDGLVHGRGSRRTAGLAIIVLFVTMLFVEWSNRSDQTGLEH